jgi:hypothetical protein
VNLEDGQEVPLAMVPTMGESLSNSKKATAAKNVSFWVIEMPRIIGPKVVYTPAQHELSF